MKVKKISEFPIQTLHNRVQRLYSGGRLLDRWQKIMPEVDSVLSEDLLVTTVDYLGPGNPDHHGVSQVLLESGETFDLRSLIHLAPRYFLGKYSDSSNVNPKVLVRVGDSNVRLVMQCHPTTAMAKKHFNIDSGKTEAWYIADTREIDGVKPHLYCGFKAGVTRESFKTLFESQDIEGMLNCLHKIEVKTGDLIMIKAGMPHAMGSGCLFIEFHEPCDYTIRVEKKYMNKILSDAEMHYGLGFETMLDFFDYTTYDEQQITASVMGRLSVRTTKEDSTLYECFNKEQSRAFSVRKLELNGVFPVEKYEDHYLMITLKNDIEIIGEDRTLCVKQGNGIFVPANCKPFSIKGQAEVLLAYPQRDDEGETQ